MPSADRTSIAIAALAVILGAGATQAGNNLWTSNGPYGGQVTVLAVDPQTPNNLYAAGISGIFKSTDGGVSWARASNGITDPTVAAIAIDPATPTTLYAGSIHGGKLVKSTDGGNSWTPSGPTLVVALAINPQATATIYASQQQSGLQKSINGGVTWAPIGVGTLPVFPTFKSIVVDPKTPTTLYAGEQSQGVFKSVDGGTTWAATNSGFTTGTIIQILRLAIDPQAPSTLYAAANTSSGHGLYKSTNGGASWTQTFADNSGIIGVQAVTVDPQNSANVYIGTFGSGAMRSVNGGADFTAINSGLAKVGVNVIALNPSSPANLYAGTQNGVFATTNSGTAWTGASNGLALTTVNAIAIDPTVQTTVYAATKLSGLFKSVDGGESWQSINNGIGATGNLGSSAPNFAALVIDPTTPGTLYAGTQGTSSSQIYKSTNGGATWTTSASGFPVYSNVSAIAIDPVGSASMFAGTTANGLFNSADGGATWTQSAGPPANSRIIALYTVTVAGASSAARSPRPSTLIAKEGASTGYISIYIDSPSGDASVSYRPPGGQWGYPIPIVDLDCIENTANGAKLLGLTASPAEIFVACFSPTARIINGETVESGGKTYHVSECCAAAAVESITLSLSNYWAAPDGSNAAASACSPVSSIVVDPSDNNKFYAGAACGVLKATDKGKQMATMSAGLPQNTAMNALALTATGSDVYAGAQSGGVWRFTTSSTPTPPVTVVEFYNQSLDHYFITWVPAEIGKLDAGTVIKGWARTGQSFKTYTAAQSGTSPVCRYYIPPALGDSHFFGRGTTECNATGQKNPSFNLEDPAFMQMFLPAAGVCPANTTQVYRVFSNRPDANHRYITDKAIRAQMTAKGWAAEGDGPDLVVMCAPQ
ncbi:MAG: hypothetical protein ABI831_16985 [Betaproteobacteria bacterium]